MSTLQQVDDSIILTHTRLVDKLKRVQCWMTQDCCANYNTSHIIKYADDTTVMGLIQDGEEKHYREEVKLFVDWCSRM